MIEKRNYIEVKLSQPDRVLLANEIYTYTALLLKFFNTAHEERLKAAGVQLRAMQFGLLSMLFYEQLTISDLSQRFGMDPSSILRIVDTLENMGLVVRGRDPRDRRRNPLQITPQGRDLVNSIPVIAEGDAPYQALQSLSLDEIQRFRATLYKLMQFFPDGRMVSKNFPGQWPDEGMPPAQPGPRD